MGLFGKKVQRLFTLTTTSETEVQRRSDLEIRPVLLQLGVVHVNGEKLKTHTNAHNQYEEGNMDFEAR